MGTVTADTDTANTASTAENNDAVEAYRQNSAHIAEQIAIMQSALGVGIEGLEIMIQNDLKTCDALQGYMYALQGCWDIVIYGSDEGMRRYRERLKEHPKKMEVLLKQAEADWEIIKKNARETVRKKMQKSAIEWATSQQKQQELFEANVEEGIAAVQNYMVAAETQSLEYQQRRAEEAQKRAQEAEYRIRMLKVCSVCGLLLFILYLVWTSGVSNVFLSLLQ